MKDASNYKKSSTTRSKTQNSVLANSTYYQFWKWFYFIHMQYKILQFYKYIKNG